MSISNLNTNWNIIVDNTTTVAFINCLTDYPRAYQLAYSNNMAWIFHNSSSSYGKLKSIVGEMSTYYVGSMYGMFDYQENYSGTPLPCGPATNSLGRSYEGTNVTGSPVCGPNVRSMYVTYWGCSKLTGQPVCGPKVTDLYGTYRFCSNLTGQPVCGPLVTNMAYAYDGCYNLTGSPVCGPNVTNMNSTYCNCYNIAGRPVCGNNVIDMRETYYKCHNIIGSPVCGPNVTYLYWTYVGCYKLTGEPACGANVTEMSGAYQNCYLLSGNPNIGPKVNSLANAYYNCCNLTGNCRLSWNPDTQYGAASYQRVDSCFYNCKKPINIYVSYQKLFNAIINTTNNHSIVGENITWTQNPTNSYIYTSSSPYQLTIIYSPEN